MLVSELYKPAECDTKRHSIYGKRYHYILIFALFGMRFAQEIVMFSFILVLLVGIGSCVTPMPPIEEGALEVVVTSTSGQALQGALFESSEQYAYTDTQGRATLSLLPGTHEYSVSAQDHETRSGTEPVRAGSTNRIYVQLEALESPCETDDQCPQGTYCTPQGACVPVEEDGTLQVTVRGTSGALQGAMLTVGQRTAQTNTQGRATLSLEAGDYDYSISYPDYEPSWGTVDITAGETTSFGVDLVPVSTPECSESDPCESGYECVEGACVAIQTGCTDDTECEQGEECVNGVCEPINNECTDDTDCGAGLVCSSAGTCVAGVSTPLLVTVQGTGNVRSTSQPEQPDQVNCGGGGFAIDCLALYPRTAVVTFTATPSAGYVLDTWSGCTPTPADQNVCTKTISSLNEQVTARFVLDDSQEPTPHTVSITRLGSGTITSTSTKPPATNQIDCRGGFSSCSAAYPEETTVTLSATADEGWTFSGWSGAVCASTEQTCTFELGEANLLLSLTRVTATFTQSVQVTFDPPACGSANGTYPHTQTDYEYTGAATFCANGLPSPSDIGYPQPGGTVSWECVSGNCEVQGTFTDQGQECEIETVSCSATREAAPTLSRLQVNKDGTGIVTSTSDPNQDEQFDCGALRCMGQSVEYPEGTEVTLMAAEYTGYTFAGWSSNCAPLGDATCAITIGESDETVTATFEEIPVAIPYYLRIKFTRYEWWGGTTRVDREFTGDLLPGESAVHKGTSPGCMAEVRVTMSDDGTVTCRRIDDSGTCNYKDVDNQLKNGIPGCYVP
jgi:hypothetical protein